MTEFSDRLKESLSNIFKQYRACKFGENDEAITLSCLYQRPKYRLKPNNLKIIRLKIAMKDSWQAGLLIFEFDAEKVNNSNVIGMKGDLENKLHSILKTNIYSDVIGGNHILLAWHFPISNVEEADEAINGAKKALDYILWNHTLPERGVIRI